MSDVGTRSGRDDGVYTDDLARETAVCFNSSLQLLFWSSGDPGGLFCSRVVSFRVRVPGSTFVLGGFWNCSLGLRLTYKAVLRCAWLTA